jgi:nitrate reductase (NAD(P)H)
VSGAVRKTKEFSMDDLANMPSITIPVTIVCDGNRRKELNMIKRGRAFNWGPGAARYLITRNITETSSTATWKGAKLSDILAQFQLEPGAKYVCFEGSEKLANGKYGTSIPLEVAMDPLNDIMLAYEMNNQRLSPDHGFPVRLIIPGYVGGRMIKWLKNIVISDKQSDSWYHYHDNRLLPPSVTFTEAEVEKWWYKEETILYELNLNSVISHPNHEEHLELKVN